MPRIRPEEVMAFRVVAHALPGADVAAHDDGTRTAMVDGIITYADGNTAALEVVMDVDAGHRRAWARIMSAGGQVIDGEGLEYTWHLTLTDNARTRDIRRDIVGILRHIEAAPSMTELGWPDGRRWHDHEDIQFLFERLGVLKASPVARAAGDAHVILSPPAFGGWAGEPDVVPTWTADFLTTVAPDVPAKLALSDHAERHAFIWTTITTRYEVLSVLDGDALPTQSPDLPAGVTHLWIGGLYGGSRVLRWHPSDGWSEVYRIPPDGHIDLPVP